jgi:hypothetical protein
MNFSPIPVHIHLLLHYATSESAPIGRGFDKWWIFLSKAGVSNSAIVILAGVLLAGLVVSGWFLAAQAFYPEASQRTASVLLTSGNSNET